MNTAISAIKDNFFKKVGVWILYPTIILIISFFMPNYLSPQFEAIFQPSSFQVKLFEKIFYLFSIFNASTTIFAALYWIRYWIYYKKSNKKEYSEESVELLQSKMKIIMDLYFTSQNLYIVIVTIVLSLFNLTNEQTILSLIYNVTGLQLIVVILNTGNWLYRVYAMIKVIVS